MMGWVRVHACAGTWGMGMGVIVGNGKGREVRTWG